LDIPSKRIIILLYVVHVCPGGRTAAIAHYVSFAQITCLRNASKPKTLDAV